MLPKKKTNTVVTKINDSVEQLATVTPTDSNNDLASIHKKNLKIVFIPKNLHSYFECVVGEHVFIDKPWTKISYKKIYDHLQLNQSESCFWKFRKNLESIKNEYVLVGYKPFSDTDEEFLICTTDQAREYIENTQKQIEHELKQKVERSMLRVPGSWESKCSDKDIEDVKPIKTRDKITYKWKLPAARLQTKAKFEDSNSKSMKNDYVKLEPRPKETFECADVLTMDSSVQAVKKMVNREMQTIPRIKNNKCIQSVAVEEEMFQLQPIAKSDKALDDFFKKHVPNLVNQLHYNELYDLYRDDYKLLKNENIKQIDQNSKVINLLPGYQNMVSQKKFVSSLTWHPTIPGIFAVSYTSNNNASYTSISLEKRAEETTKLTVKDEKYGISYGDDEINQESWNNPVEAKLVDENYKEKVMSLLNKEFIQRMRIIQINEDEKTNEQHDRHINRQLRDNSYIYDSHEQSTTDLQSNLKTSTTVHRDSNQIEKWRFFEKFNNILIDENAFGDGALSDSEDIYALESVENLNALNSDEELSSQEYENEYKTQSKNVKETTKATNVQTNEYKDKDEVDHHDSDTESFYNIWGDDEEWLYGNKLRNDVRNIHRKFNRKYDREAREEKLFKLLKSEAKYTDKQNKIEDMEKERMKLTKDMFEAGDMYKRLKSQEKLQSKKRRKSSLKEKKQYKVLQNEEESMVKRENTSIIDEQNNSVIIWSVNDNIFPKLRLESPEDVCCVEFNPRNGNTVIGGLTNGQICIWDIMGKLENLDSNDLGMSEMEKKHRKHLWTHMKWSLDVNFKTRIRPAALSAILESHDSTVTAIQWIHPLNEITPLGQLVTVQEGRFSDQFFSSSMDGTIKLWDMQSTPLPKAHKKSTTNARFGRPENLNDYASPLNVYNNRLKPSYTIKVMEPENTVCSPITAMSFEIPLMRYRYTSSQPLVIGIRQFEYVPTPSDDLNRVLVVGNIMGQIGVITWNGYDKRQPSPITEDCKHIWWGHVHDGPINCIKRNVFYPDIHLVCGGHVVSVWSLNYQGGPVWWKRFDNFTNSVLWSTVHPAEFLVSFNTSGVIQFWNLMKYTHQPSYTSDIFLSDGLIATLSAPRPSVHYVGAERPAAATAARGMIAVLDPGGDGGTGLICFSDSAGTIMAITVDAPAPGPDEVRDAGHAFQDEVDRRCELDEWNDKYRKRFGLIGENNVDDYDPAAAAATAADGVDPSPPAFTQEQVRRKVCDETFRWYVNRNGPQTRLNRFRDRYLEREKRYMVETMMKKKNVDRKQLAEYRDETEASKCNQDDRVARIRQEADESYRDIVNKLLAVERAEEYMFDVDSKRSTKSDEIKQIHENIHRLLVTDMAVEKQKLSDYVKNNPYRAEQEDWARIIEFAEKEIRDRFNDPTLLRSPALRVMRRKLAKKYMDEGYKIREQKGRRDEIVNDRHEIRERRIDKLRAMYGKNYSPNWDAGRTPRMRDAVRMRTGGDPATADCYEQSYDSYSEGETIGEGDNYYGDYLSLLETDSTSGHYSKRPLLTADVDDRTTLTTESQRLGEHRWNTEYEEYHELETLDEQDQFEENSINTNESDEHA